MNWDSVLMSGLIGGIAGGLAALVFAIFKPRLKCPNCGETMPKFHRPANRRQTLGGGCTCLKCGCAMDRRGRKIMDQK